MKIATLLLLLAACRAMQDEEMLPRQILEGPETQVVSSDESSVTFNCRIRGEDVEWTINGKLSDQTENTRLIGLGVEFNKSPRLNGQINASITFPNIPYFNSTRVICVSLNASGTSQSSEAVMIIAGPPLPPAPQLEVLSTTSVRVSWEEPFTWELFPVLSYQVSVYNVSSGTYNNTFTLSGNETSQVITRQTETTVCSELRLGVTAKNGEGESAAGTTSGGFPVAPSDFPYKPTPDVKFEADGTPTVKVIFNPPTICSFQEAFYQLKVFKDGSNEQVIETERQRIDNSQSVVEAEITSMILQANKDYQATLLYETNFSTLEAEMQFSTAFHPTAPGVTDDGKGTTTTDGPAPSRPTTPDTGKSITSGLKDGEDRPGNLVAIISSTTGGVLVLGTLVLIIIIVIIIILRRQQRGNEVQKRNSMVDNPLYEGPIYEVISENKRRKQLCPKAKVHAEESVYLDSPTQSMPRDCTPSYSNSAVVIANSMANGKASDRTVIKLDLVESSLDHHPLQTNPYTNSSMEPVTEDAYTLMRPAPLATSLNDHTNYLVAHSNEERQFVLDASSPRSSGTSQKQVTLV
jgi:hypothetical protein